MPEPIVLPERRREQRVWATALVNVVAFARGGGTELIMGRTLDLSPSGARIELHRPLARGTRVALSMARGEHVLEGEGEVRFLLEVDPRTFQVGVELHGLDQDTQRLLNLYLHRRRSLSIQNHRRTQREHERRGA